MNKWILAVVMVVSGSPALMAEDAPDIPPPTMPLLRRLPAAAEWTVTIRRDRDKAKEEMTKGKKEETPSEELGGATSNQAFLEPNEITITKQGNLIRETTRWTNGKTTEKWISGTFQLREAEQNNSIYRVMTPRSFYSPDYSDYSNSDFEECEWITMNNYKGVQRINGRPMYVFEAGTGEKTLTNREKADKTLLERDGPAVATPAATRRFAVYLDVQKQVPLFSDNGSEVRFYTYSPDAPAPLSLPERFESALKDWKTEIAQKTRVPTPP